MRNNIPQYKNNNLANNFKILLINFNLIKKIKN